MIWLDPTGSRVRVIDGDPKDRPPYRVLGLLTYHHDVAVIDGLLGRIKPCEVLKFYKMLRDVQGMRWLIAERQAIHKLPMGERIKGPHPFAGWYAVDLTKLDDENG